MGKKDTQKELGLNVDLGMFGIQQEDLKTVKNNKNNIEEVPIDQIDFSNIDEVAIDNDSGQSPLGSPSKEPILEEVNDGEVTPSQSNNVPVKEDAQYLVDKINLTKDGRVLRYTALFMSKPAYGRGKFSFRKLKVKRKKMQNRNHFVFNEDQCEHFHRNIISRSKETTPSYYSLVLSSGSIAQKRASARVKAIQDIFIQQQSSVDSTFTKQQDQVNQIDPKSLHPINVTEWENLIVYDFSVPKKSSVSPFLYAGVSHSAPSLNSLSSSRSGSLSISRPNSPFPSMPTMMRSGSATSFSASGSRPQTPSHVAAPKSAAGRILNLDFANANWEDQIFWDTEHLPASMPPIQLQLNLNDPMLIFETMDMNTLTEKLLKTEKMIQKRLKKLRHGTTTDGKALVIHKYDKPINDRFNLSNDKQYELLATQRSSSNSGPYAQKSTNHHRIISASRMGVQHAIPALKLSLPYYKTFWSKGELRSWHRPAIETKYLINKSISFCPLRATKDEVGKKSAAVLFNSSKKITLRGQQDEFILCEYIEEFPILLSNIGMSSFVNLYYRKTNPKDLPEFPQSFGMPRVLEGTDPSPFWIFGDVRPGETLPTLQNNLFRAPMHAHNSENTDFVIIKSNAKGENSSTWYIRPLPSSGLLTVGQVFPTSEVFGPHSRKLNNFCRNRIQCFAYRLFKKDGKNRMNGESPRLKISRILAAFPQFSEGSMRKWLKEYAESIRMGQDSGTWKLKDGAPILSEEDLRSLITPEMICQYESMIAGQQRLHDAGIMDSGEVEGLEDEVEVDAESAETRLAPWNLSANFISASTGKCTLELRGVGDPSGRGEAFSFLKAPLRMVVSSKLSSIPEATTEGASTSSTSAGPKIPPEQVAYRKEIVQIWDNLLRSIRSITTEEEPHRNQDFSMFEEAQEHPQTRNDLHSDGESTTSFTSKSSVSKGQVGRKMVITRTFIDPNTGEETCETETIEDGKLLTAYINQRRSWEKKRKRRDNSLAALASRSKKVKSESSTAATSSTPKPASIKIRKEVSVKCGTCGQVGHMRTNRICPRFAEYEAEMPNQASTVSSRIDYSQVSTKISLNRNLIESAKTATPAPMKVKISLSAIKAAATIEAQTSLPLPSISKIYIENKAKSRTDKHLESFHPSVRESVIKFSEQLVIIMEKVMADREAWPFNKPVSKIDYPHYFQIIDHPLDFGTIKSRAKRHQYTEIKTFLNDVQLVHDNCVKFNTAEHAFSQTASRLVDMVVGLCKEETLVHLEELINKSSVPEDGAEVIIDN